MAVLHGFRSRQAQIRSFRFPGAKGTFPMFIITGQQFSLVAVGTFRVELQKASVAHQIMIEHPEFAGMTLGTDNSHFSFSFRVHFFISPSDDVF